MLIKRMKRIAPLSFAMLACGAHAESTQAEQIPLTPFDARVQLAKAAESDERFKTYRSAMLRQTGRRLARTMRSCIAAAPKPEQKTVVLIANINSMGKATGVEVKPENAVAKCYAAGFSALSYPRPPAYFERQGFPVTMKIRVIP